MFKRFLSALSALAVMFTLLPSVVAFAGVVYIPTSTSTQYLPTVKILSYSLGYDGSLVPEAYGSGTLIDNKGTILTNSHVIQSMFDPSSPNDAFQVCLTVSNDVENPVCEFTASLIAHDPDKDIAILKMDKTNVMGQSVKFDFSLPYDNDAKPEVGDTVTVLGYPDTGGRTITFTQGVVSGFTTENGLKYIKTDADISFGNSGGTAVDSKGNLLGIPTFIIGSYSAEVLGYLIPVSRIVSWIDENKNKVAADDSAAKGQLRDAMKANIDANKKGTYKNDYPPYEISIIDGWKFGNSLEGAFENSTYGYAQGTNSVIIYPKEMTMENAANYVSVSVTDYGYEVTLEDIEYLLGSYSKDVYMDSFGTGATYERAKLNDKYDAIKETFSYSDWYTGAYVNTVTYYVPYGDMVLNVGYSYGGEQDLTDMEKIVGTFQVDMSKVKLSVVNEVYSKALGIKVKNPLGSDYYLSDSTYSYGGQEYFGATFGKKRDYSFVVSVYSAYYWNEEHKGNFAKFKEDTIKDAELWYEIASKGDLTLDGHQGFYLTDQYDYGFGETSYYTTIYLENANDSYISIYYSGTGDSFTTGMKDFKKILKSVQLSNKGKGKYKLPNFMGSGGGAAILSDIKNYVYETQIRNLSRDKVFGETSPTTFNPESALSRKDFVVWAIKANATVAADFEIFKAAYTKCSEECYKDVDYDSDEAVYIEYAKSKEVISKRDKFSPDEQITLMAAFKVAFELYDYKIWKAPSFVPWYVPYLHIGYSYGYMPYGVDEAEHKLTRGEGAFIIDSSRWGGAIIYSGDTYYSEPLMEDELIY